MDVLEAPDDVHAERDLTAVLHAAQGGDEEAFRTVYRAWQPALLRYLRALVKDDADDVASETWLQIARDLSGFRGDWDKFRGWTATIARHRAMDHLRRAKRRPVVATPTEYLVELTDDRDTATDALAAVGTGAALAMIAKRPREQGEAVLLRAVLGLSAQDAGKVLGKRAGAVRTAAYRGLRRLAQLLGDGSGDGP